jgi:hypothetical protein
VRAAGEGRGVEGRGVGGSKEWAAVTVMADREKAPRAEATWAAVTVMADREQEGAGAEGGGDVGGSDGDG